jgi:hypothetical protein
VSFVVAKAADALARAIDVERSILVLLSIFFRLEVSPSYVEEIAEACDLFQSCASKAGSGGIWGGGARGALLARRWPLLPGAGSLCRQHADHRPHYRAKQARPDNPIRIVDRYRQDALSCQQHAK